MMIQLKAILTVAVVALLVDVANAREGSLGHSESCSRHSSPSSQSSGSVMSLNAGYQASSALSKEYIQIVTKFFEAYAKPTLKRRKELKQFVEVHRRANIENPDAKSMAKQRVVTSVKKLDEIWNQSGFLGFIAKEHMAKKLLNQRHEDYEVHAPNGCIVGTKPEILDFTAMEVERSAVSLISHIMAYISGNEVFGDSDATICEICSLKTAIEAFKEENNNDKLMADAMKIARSSMEIMDNDYKEAKKIVKELDEQLKKSASLSKSMGDISDRPASLSQLKKSASLSKSMGDISDRPASLSKSIGDVSDWSASLPLDKGIGRYRNTFHCRGTSF